MLFNSVSFAVFLPVVYLLYWFATKRSVNTQNLLLLIASYFFYSCWDWRFLFLLIFSTVLDYYTGIKVYESSKASARKFWFWLSVITNLGFLAIFKYFNFFSLSFASALGRLGIESDPLTLNILLPVGISFYTFHGLSYLIDIYKKRIQPERNIVDYSLFVSFFPLLVAGPIERATHLLPQLKNPRGFNYSKMADGLRQILWGLFKKIVIADSCAEYVNLIFDNHEAYPGSTLLLGAIFFSFQIYCDFSGYSDIALGTARLFGIELLRNFNFPYFSRNIAEFWRRWHISLSTWFRDYLYIPLGGSKGSKWMQVRNTLIIFVVSGFWHGANWTFIVWGFLHALYIMPSILLKNNRRYLSTPAEGQILPGFREGMAMLITFLLTTIAWVFFRADNVVDAFNYTSKILSASILTPSPIFPISLVLLVITFILIEWFGRSNTYAIQLIGKIRITPIRWAIYYALVIGIFLLGKYNGNQFIYFQF